MKAISMISRRRKLNEYSGSFAIDNTDFWDTFFYSIKKIKVIYNVKTIDF